LRKALQNAPELERLAQRDPDLEILIQRLEVKALLSAAFILHADEN